MDLDLPVVEHFDHFRAGYTIRAGDRGPVHVRTEAGSSYSGTYHAAVHLRFNDMASIRCGSGWSDGPPDVPRQRNFVVFRESPRRDVMQVACAVMPDDTMINQVEYGPFLSVMQDPGARRLLLLWNISRRDRKWVFDPARLLRLRLAGLALAAGLMIELFALRRWRGGRPPQVPGTRPTETPYRVSELVVPAPQTVGLSWWVRWHWLGVVPVGMVALSLIDGGRSGFETWNWLRRCLLEWWLAQLGG